MTKKTRDIRKRTKLQQERGEPGSIISEGRYQPPPRCFRCDGTGELCRVCGETEKACLCDGAFALMECEDCNGTGK